ncbi:haloacid dehalogenase, type II [Cryptococcus sp. DSM 104549]
MDTCKALIFDCYGDWERGMFENLQPIFAQKTCPDIEKVLRTLGNVEGKIQAEDKTMIYPAVLKLAYTEMAGELRLWPDDDAAQAFGESVGSWPAFPDSADALERLHDLGIKLFVLSNVDNDSFEVTRKQLETGWGEFDGVYTAEDIGTYKPDLRNFRYALKRLDEDFDIDMREVICVANSKFHDIIPAKRMGLQAAWINRPNAVMGVQGYEGVKPDWVFSSMEEFAGEMERIREDL